MSDLKELLRRASPAMPEIENHLNELTPDRRVDEVRELGRRELSRLYEVAEGYLPISMDQLVPSSETPMNEVIHFGKNSLGAFSHFQKVFVRPDVAASEGELWGYNRTTGLVQTTVGPGYFVAYPHVTEGELLVDYLRLPPAKPAHWPEILPNSARLSFFVYNGTQDVLRGVSDHVSIGRATKKGKPMSAWFVLCRKDN